MVERAVTRRVVLRALGGAVACVVARPAGAEAKFPTRPISVVVPYDAGGPVDVVTRAFTPVLERIAGQPVAVVNRPGASGAVGLQAVARGRADGYTLAAAPISIVTTPEVDKLFGRAPSFSTDMFVPLALLTIDPLIVVVRTESPWTSLDALVAGARQKPGQLKYPSSGLYGPSHVATEIFAATAGINVVHVPFTGAAPALTALLGGHVDFYLSPNSICVQHVRSGTLRALAAYSKSRHPEQPTVKTAAELGYRVDFANWYGLFAPAQVPPDVLAVLREQVAKAGRDPAFRENMARIRTPVDFMDADAFTVYLEQQKRLLRETIQRIGRVG